MSRRLRHVAAALLRTQPQARAQHELPPPPSASTSGRVLEEIAQGELGIPLHLVRQPTSFRPVHIGADGRLLPSEVEALETALAERPGEDDGAPELTTTRRRRALAAEQEPQIDRKGYRPDDCGLPTRREELAQLLATLGPRPRLTLPDCTPRGIVAQRAFFRENGFVIVDGILQGESLRAAQSAFSEAMAGPLAAWEEAQRGGGRRETEPWFYLEPRKDMYIGIDLDHAASPVLLEILDSPQLLPVVQSIMVDDDDEDHFVTSGLLGGRVVPCYPEEDGYCSWHRDRLPLGSWPHMKPRGIKAMYYFFDCAEDGGPTAVCPGSHRLPEAPEQTIAQSFSGGGQLDGELPLEALPNNVRAACKAGSALLFDTACWHTAFPCTGSEPRRTAIIGYSVNSRAEGKRAVVDRDDADSPIAQLEKAGLLQRPSLRRVLNVEA